MREQISKLRKLAKITDSAAPSVASAVQVEVRTQGKQGIGPDGQPFQLTRDGRRALKNVAQSLKATADGSTIFIEVIGRHARHHRGWVKGKVKREVIPTGKLTPQLIKTISGALTDEFQEIMD